MFYEGEATYCKDKGEIDLRTTMLKSYQNQIYLILNNICGDIELFVPDNETENYHKKQISLQLATS